MYDRKTWIVVTLCALLLGLNFYFAPKPPVPAPETASEQAAVAQPAPALTAPQAGLEVIPPVPAVEEKLLKLETDKATFVLTNMGAAVKETLLKDEHEIGAPDKMVAINNKGLGVATLVEASSAVSDVRFDDGTKSPDGRSIVYVGQTPSGLKVTKTFSLVDPKLVGGGYLLDLNLTIDNATAAPVSLANWSLALGTAAPLYELETPNWTSFFWRGNGEYTYEDATFFKGGMFSSDKASFETPIEAAEYTGVANQFFATVVRSKEPFKATLWARPVEVNLPSYEGGLSRPAVRGGMGLPPVDVAVGEQRSLAFQIFMGPKKNQMLRDMDGNLGDIMNYGPFRIVSNPLNWLLNKLHGWFDPISPKWSWGFAVVALTIVIRTLIWPLHAKSTRTMKRMSKIQPEQKALKEKYGDDPTRLNQETMKLYKKYSVNPLGGCLPMLLQIPIFFGFYRMLQYAVELRHQEFLWWVSDLSQPDTIYTFEFMGWSIPLNLLPILMGITMVIQMRMTPQTGDAMQRKIMMFMPLIFLYFCYSFASALALYWTTQNIFSIGQTWLMNKMPEPELQVRKAGKKSWVEKLSERQIEMKKAQKSGGGGAAGPGPSKKKRPPRTGG